MKETVEKILAGDKEAFRDIVKAHGPSMRVYLNGRISDRQAVEDLMQEIFVAVYWNLDSYDSSRDLGLWIRAVTRNKLMSWLRSRYSQKNSINVKKVSIEETILPDLEKYNPDSESVVQKLRECIARQNEKNSELIRARYFDNESVTDTAARLQTTVSAISSDLYRIRKQLKICVEKGEAL